MTCENTGRQSLCAQCNVTVIPEDSVYDDHTSQYFCDKACFLDWADDNNEVITEYYVRLNVTGG